VTSTRLRIGAIATVLYFSEGFPYGVVKDLVPVYLRFHHIELQSIGLLNIVGFAWAFKFAWSPAIDAFATYRRWIAAALAVIVLALGGIATLPIGWMVYGLVAILALASATQDIAVDAFTIRAVPNEMRGPINSIRVTAYRAALMAAGGGILALAGFIGWRNAFLCATFLAAIIFLFALTLPGDRGERRAEKIDVVRELRRWLTRERAGTLLAIVFLYRLGELAIVSIVKLYWVDRGYSPKEIGTITSVIGVIVSVAGAIAGGAFLARVSLYRGLLILGIAQTMSNIGYAVVATMNAGKWAIYAAAIVENFGYGLGTAAFLSFLMSLCSREHAATDYALLTAAFNATGNVMSSASGAIAQHAGYAAYFWLTVFLGIPSLWLIMRARDVLENGGLAPAPT
jgi:PAT family beta-lactamase induction signal transducer AmpG